MINVERYSTLADLPASAHALLDAAVVKNPFVSTPWLAAFERHLVKDGQRALYLVVIEDSTARVVLPLCAQHKSFLGVTKLQSLGNFYTGIFDAVLDQAVIDQPSLRSETLAALADYIARHYRAVPLIELSPLRGTDSFAGSLMQALAQRRYAVRRFSAHGNWHEAVSGLDFAAYLARRPGSVRSTLMRKRAKLRKELGYEVVVHVEPAAIETAFADYQAVYDASWKSAELSPAFIKEVMTRLARHRIVNLGVLSIRGQPAAAQLWVKIESTWAVFKLAYNPSFGQYSIGTILMAHLLEGFFAAAPVDSVDFLSGDDGYKSDWAKDRRDHWGYEAISSGSVLGQALRLKRRISGVKMAY